MGLADLIKGIPLQPHENDLPGALRLLVEKGPGSFRQGLALHLLLRGKAPVLGIGQGKGGLPLLTPQVGVPPVPGNGEQPGLFLRFAPKEETERTASRNTSAARSSERTTSR